MDHCVEYAKGIPNVVQYWSRIHKLMDEVPKHILNTKKDFGQRLI